MTIIEEMREMAGRMNEAGLHWERDRLLNWADYLERSGALVPVADGEVKALRHAPRGLITADDGNIYISAGARWYSLFDHGRYVTSFDSIVQPVRLVPITVAEIDG